MPLEILTVTARDPAALTVTVARANEPSAEPVVCPVAGGWVPKVGGTCFVETGSGSWVAVGAPAVAGAGAIPKAKLRSTAQQIPAAAGTPEKFSFAAAGGSTEFDTDFDGTTGMADRTNSRIYARWPGSYLYGYHWHIAAGGNVSVFGDVRLNGSLFLPPRHFSNSTNGPWDTHASDLRSFAAGDYIELWITGQGVGFGTSSNELGMNLWMTYLG